MPMKFLLMLLSVTLFAAMTTFAQTPPIEPGVSHDLAIWRAARYSDVRYKLNLTLEKMSPVLKGTIEIRVNVGPNGGAGTLLSPSAQRADILNGAGTLLSPSAQRADLPPINGGAGTLLSPSAQGADLPLPPIILDWRKIRGHEELSTISNISINGKPVPLLSPPGGDGDRSVPAPFEESNDHLIFRDGVTIGENVIKLDFTSPILTSGSAITRYIDKEDGSEYLYSLFVPSDASTAFPVFDQPDLKATFSLTLETPGEWKVVSNTNIGELVGTVNNDNFDPKIGWSGTNAKIFHFAETKPISTYVFAFAAGPWERVSSPHVSKGSTGPAPNVEPSLTVGLPTLETSIYVRKSQASKFQPHAAEVFRLTREGVKYLEGYFDYKFPWPKYDLVLIPEFPFGGMEHAGATFVREQSIIFPTEPTKSDYINRATLIFHETAHQWFGDTVTMKWFDDLWLKEGFANFMAYKAMEKIMPEMNAWKVFYERIKQPAYATDSTKGTTPIYQPIANLSAAKSAYGNIVYNKAPAFLRQAEFYLGEDKFRTAVRAFLKKHEYANAGWEDLVKEFEVSTGQDLDYWANTWIKTPGLPKFLVDFRNKDGDIFFGVVQKPPQGQKAIWPMKTNALFKVKTVPDQEEQIISFDQTKDAALVNETCDHCVLNPFFAFSNYQDYGYGIFLLDDKSRDYVLKNIGSEKDDFLRSMMWGSLWDSVREGELDPKEYVELVVANLGGSVQKPARSKGIERSTTPSTEAASTPPNQGGEQDEGIIQSLLSRVSTAMNYYVSETEGVSSPRVSKGATQPASKVEPSLTVGLQTRLEAVLIDRMQNAPTLGQKITFYRAFLNIASTEFGRTYLRRLLFEAGVPSVALSDGGKQIVAKTPSIPLRSKDKFDIVTRLIILGDAWGAPLLADLEKTETSDDAKRYAYAAHAAFATKENREKFWNDFVSNKQISESWIEAAIGPFNSIRHDDLSLPYLQRALAELPILKRDRKIFFVNGWLGAFIGGQKSQAALDIVNKFLADNPNLDNDLRLKILENVDVIERAVKIRSRYKSPSASP